VHDVVDVHAVLQRHYAESAAEFAAHFEAQAKKAAPTSKKPSEKT
jgi:cyclopropane fatty-acyl-phospholipid synthase-like methyltransferase